MRVFASWTPLASSSMCPVKTDTIKLPSSRIQWWRTWSKSHLHWPWRPRMSEAGRESIHARRQSRVWNIQARGVLWCYWMRGSASLLLCVEVGFVRS